MRMLRMEIFFSLMRGFHSILAAMRSTEKSRSPSWSSMARLSMMRSLGKSQCTPPRLTRVPILFSSSVASMTDIRCWNRGEFNNIVTPMMSNVIRLSISWMRLLFFLFTFLCAKLMHAEVNTKSERLKKCEFFLYLGEPFIVWWRMWGLDVAEKVL